MKDSSYRYLGNRRDFLRTAACAALSTTALTNAIRDLRLINAAAAQQTLTDYKALVCVFLSGGNDSNNLVVPKEATAHANYAAIRGNLTIPQSSLLDLNAINDDGRQYGLHPSCTELQTLFSEQKLALLFNTGTLVYPMTRTQYTSNSVKRPPQLFSHSDQVTQWQTSIPDQQPKSGWGGRCADILHPQQLDLLNGVPTANSAKIALCTSIAGQNTFEVGNTFQQYHVSTTGAVLLSGLATGSAQLNALKALLAAEDVNLQQETFSQVLKGSIDSGELLNNAIIATRQSTDNPPGTWIWNTPFPNLSLSNQLKMVARLIEARSDLNMKRQIFFVTVGGYDTHTGQVNADTTTGNHANLLREISRSFDAFYRATAQLGVADKVTTFTASDFGRTFPTNGVGSDHGWGSHHIIMGGAVNGKRTYGTFPIHTINGPDDTSTGRWIPRTSVDEYSATLARWFGVSNSDLAYVFPNLGRFAAPNLGFML